jgi:hypothetical protein
MSGKRALSMSETDAAFPPELISIFPELVRRAAALCYVDPARKHAHM